MAKVEQFLFEIGAVIRKRKRNTILADVEHPDGFDCSVCFKYEVVEDEEENFLEVRRRAGDAVLFYVVFQKLTEWDCGKGRSPAEFYDGQICPRVIMQPKLHPDEDVPWMSLDGYGTKRKAAEIGEESDSSA